MKQTLVSRMQNDVVNQDSQENRFTQILTSLLHPYSTVRLVWELHIFLFVIYNALFIPFRCAFGPYDLTYFYVIDYLTDIVFYIDIWLNFYTPHSMDEVVRFDHNTLKKRYMESWFPWDVMSVLPYDIIAAIVGRVYLPYLRIPRIFKVVRLYQYAEKWEMEWKALGSYFRIWLLFFTLMMTSHWIACLWWTIGYRGGVDSASWVNAANIGKDDTYTQYLHSLYWSIVVLTTIGFGDVVARSDSERIMSICTMLVGAFFYGLLFGNIASVLSTLDAASSRLLQNASLLRKYMTYHKLPQELRIRITSYFDATWTRERGLDEHRILDDLPSALRSEIAVYIHRELVNKVGFFQAISNAGFINSLVLKLRPQIALPGEMIVREGDLPNEMFFLSKGSVEVTVNGTTLCILKEGSYFGEVSLIFQERRTASVSAIEYTELLVLTKSDFESSVQYFPEFATMIRDIAKERKSLSTYHSDAELMQNYFRKSREPPADGKSKSSVDFSSVKKGERFITAVELYQQQRRRSITLAQNMRVVGTRRSSSVSFREDSPLPPEPDSDASKGDQGDGSADSPATNRRLSSTFANMSRQGVLRRLSLSGFSNASRDSVSSSNMTEEDRAIAAIAAAAVAAQAAQINNGVQPRASSVASIESAQLPDSALSGATDINKDDIPIVDKFPAQSQIAPSKMEQNSDGGNSLQQKMSPDQIGESTSAFKEIEQSHHRRSVNSNSGRNSSLQRQSLTGMEQSLTLSEAPSIKLSAQPIPARTARMSIASVEEYSINQTAALPLAPADVDSVPETPTLQSRFFDMIKDHLPSIPSVLHHDSDERLYLMILTSLAILYNIWMIPFRIGFASQVGGFLLPLDYITDMIFIIDICANFYTTHLNELGARVTDPILIRRRYLKGWFWFDAITMIPLDLWVFSTGLKYIGLLRLPRFFKVFRLLDYADLTEQRLQINPSIFRIIKLFGFFLLFAHTTGCLWYVIPDVTNHDKDWRIVYHLDGAPLHTKYIASLYFAATVICTVGFGDIVAVNNTERIFLIIVMLIGSGIYSTVFGSMVTLVSALNADSQANRQKLNNLEEYMKLRFLPEDIRQRVRTFHDIIWSRHKGLDETAIFRQLPPALRSEVAQHLYRQTLQDVPLFQGSEASGLLNSIVLMLRPQMALPGEYIIRQGEVGDEMYIVQTGQVEVVRDGRLITKIGAKSYFGEISLIFSQKRTASVLAAEYSELLMLTKSDLQQLLRVFPEFSKLLTTIAKDRMKESNTNVEGKVEAESIGSQAWSKVRKKFRSVLASAAKDKPKPPSVEEPPQREGYFPSIAEKSPDLRASSHLSVAQTVSQPHGRSLTVPFQVIRETSEGNLQAASSDAPASHENTVQLTEVVPIPPPSPSHSRQGGEGKQRASSLLFDDDGQRRPSFEGAEPSYDDDEVPGVPLSSRSQQRSEARISRPSSQLSIHRISSSSSPIAAADPTIHANDSKLSPTKSPAPSEHRHPSVPHVQIQSENDS
eukprot:TRINITY_DN4714_c0_g1_i4.p1 TRINITY_DN4714_c0_g1~~TRINITY_DN4714_c0_g1_i4.p1  ORF type:complete len:1498 (-),score=299.51 TRINITY_DN4714_c0_g1_i4:714-5207(-)